MADKYRNIMGAYIRFVAGERPVADKFNALVAQSKFLGSTLERALGDIHDENYPYGTPFNGPAEDTRLTHPWGQGQLWHTAGRGRPLNIANIGRLIGPASNLNSRLLPGTHSVTEDLPSGGYEFVPRYPMDTNPELVFVNAANIQTKVDGTNLLVLTGDWTIDNNVVRVFDEFNGGTVTYNTTAELYYGGPNPLRTSFNVIPDPNQSTGCEVQEVQGGYEVTLPTASHQQDNSGLRSTTALESDNANKNSQLELPYVIYTDLVPGQTIPSGFLFLRNELTGINYKDAVYKTMVDGAATHKYMLRVEGVDLGQIENQKWVIVTVGTEITTSIDDLREKWFSHSHDRMFGESAVSVQNLVGLFDASKRLQYTASTGKWNPLPTYLHRDGYVTHNESGDAESPMNSNNAMRGPLHMGRAKDGNETNITSPTEVAGEYPEGMSWPVSFGGEPPATLDNLGKFSEHAPYIDRGTAGDLRIISQGRHTGDDGRFPNDPSADGYTPDSDWDLPQEGTPEKNITMVGRKDINLDTKNYAGRDINIRARRHTNIPGGAHLGGANSDPPLMDPDNVPLSSSVTPQVKIGYITLKEKLFGVKENGSAAVGAADPKNTIEYWTNFVGGNNQDATDKRIVSLVNEFEGKTILSFSGQAKYVRPYNTSTSVYEEDDNIYTGGSPLDPWGGRYSGKWSNFWHPIGCAFVDPELNTNGVHRHAGGIEVSLGNGEGNSAEGISILISAQGNSAINPWHYLRAVQEKDSNGNLVDPYWYLVGVELRLVYFYI